MSLNPNEYETLRKSLRVMARIEGVDDVNADDLVDTALDKLMAWCERNPGSSREDRRRVGRRIVKDLAIDDWRRRKRRRQVSLDDDDFDCGARELEDETTRGPPEAADIQDRMRELDRILELVLDKDQPEYIGDRGDWLHEYDLRLVRLLKADPTRSGRELGRRLKRHFRRLPDAPFGTMDETFACRRLTIIAYRCGRERWRRRHDR